MTINQIELQLCSPKPAALSEGFEQCAQAIDDLFHDALKKRGATAFDEFLQFACRFSDLSMYNAMLVKIQRPGAAAVATATRWSGMGGQIRPGAIPIVILRPFGPVALVYEYSDVYGASILGAEASALLATGEISRKAYDRVISGAARFRIQVTETETYGSLMAGTAEALSHLPGVLTTSKDGPLWSVRVNAHHDLATRFATLAHELGHIYCGHLGAHPKERWPDRERIGISHAQREMEAEAVCWLVCNRNGVGSRSAEYLHSLMKKADVSKVSIHAIYMAANLVEAR